MGAPTFSPLFHAGAGPLLSPRFFTPERGPYFLPRFSTPERGPYFLPLFHAGAGPLSRYASVPVWLIAVVVLAIVIAAILVVAVERPRTIEDELHQSRPAPPVTASPLQVSPSPGVPLATTIDALIRSKATGMLAVTSGDQSCSLYFLFGHLFHAETGGLKGEDALEVALAWLHPSTTFDPQAHLPSQETILRSQA